MINARAWIDHKEGVPFFLCATLFWMTTGAIAQAPPGQPDHARLRQTVELLASPEFGGRRGEGGTRASAYLADQFKRLKLAPLFDGQYFQPIPGQEAGTVQGRNVGAILHGSDPELRAQYVIVSAHFDHLGVRNGRLYPGADDNASGVAMMLELARSFAGQKTAPPRSLIFIGFDLEEVGLFGSRFFVAHPPVPLDKIGLFVTADMIGRALAGLAESYVFIIGSEYAPALRPWIDQSARDRPLTVGLLGADITVLNRSDYGPFRAKNIPFLFFTTGENPRYHTPADTADTLDYKKLTAISQMIHQIVSQAASAPALPRWQSEPDYPLAEAVAIREIMKLLLANSEKLEISPVPLFVMKNTLALLDQIVMRGRITPDERARVIQGARVVLFTVL